MSLNEILWPETPFPLQQHLLLATRRGSESHNTYVKPTDPNSIDDRDIYAVVAPPRNYYLGMRHWEHAESIKTAEDGTVWDVCLDEVVKFCALLTKCNPNVLSALWTRPEERLYVSPLFQPLLDNRELFLSKQYAFEAFGGYARAQAKKMKLNAYNGIMGAKRKALVDKYGYDCKNAAHCIRLMNMGIELLLTGQVNVWRTWDRDRIIAIKTGQWSFEDVQAHFACLEADLNDAKARSVLPEQPDLEAIDKLVTDVVWSAL